MECSFLINNSHYLIVTDDNKKLLIDTGSPNSFCLYPDGMQLDLGERRYSIEANLAMMEDINASNLLTERVHALIGMDILCNHILEFDKSRNVLFVDAEDSHLVYEHSIPVDCFNLLGFKGITLDVTINNHQATTLLDTGACISYLSSSYLDGVDVIGDVHDYNPILGPIETTKHEVVLSMGDFSQNLVVAKSPMLLEQTLRMLNVSVILGLDAIECDKICLDFINQAIKF